MIFRQESRAIAGRNVRCRCKFRYLSNFTTGREWNAKHGNLVDADASINPSINLKLISWEINFKVFQPMWSRYLNVMDRRTDRQHTVA